MENLIKDLEGLTLNLPWGTPDKEPLETISIAISELRKYEELKRKISNGRLVELQCSVGDTVYYIRNGLIYFSTISKIEIFGNSIMFSMDDHYYGYTVSFYGYEFGKRIFFTPEAAEEKIEELKNK